MGDLKWGGRSESGGGRSQSGGDISKSSSKSRGRSVDRNQNMVVGGSEKSRF